jgi:hypothetical protein
MFFDEPKIPRAPLLPESYSLQNKIETLSFGIRTYLPESGGRP